MRVKILFYGLVLLIFSCRNNGSNKPINETKTASSNTQLDSIFQVFKESDSNYEPLVTAKTKDLKTDFNASAKNLNNKAIEILSGVSGEPITSQDSLHLESALTFLNKAIKLDSQYYLAYANKANILSKLKRYNEAIEILERIIKIRPDYAEGIANQGFLYEKMGDINKADEKYKSAIGAYIRRLNDPYKIMNKINVQVDIAFMLLFTESKEMATQAIDTIIARNPDSKIAIYMKGTIMSFNRQEFIKNF